MQEEECHRCQWAEHQGTLSNNPFANHSYRAQKKEKKADPIPKLFENDRNSMMKRFINNGFKLTYIVFSFGRRVLWFGSCFVFLYMIPMGFEIFSEQNKIL